MSDTSELRVCPHCGQEVPAGEYCGACGAHLVEGAPRALHRPHAFAASPHEHLFHLTAVSTLFPHLPHRHSAPFRVALLVVTIGLIILGYLRLSGPSIALAALAVPLLYLLYLYEVEVYEEEPVLVIGVTLALGILIGVLWARWTGNFVTQTLILNASPAGASTGRLLLAAALIPLAAQLLMLAGAIIMFLTRRYAEALDGFAFGAAGAMGFIFAATLVELLPELRAGMTSVAPALDNALRTLQRGLLIPFIDASTAGSIGSALWLQRAQRRRLTHHNWTTSLVVSILVAAAVQVGLGFANVYITSQAAITILYAIVAAALLIWVRVVLHHCLLAEAVETEIGPIVPCSHCRRLVPRMAFCPNCGLATRAAPKTGVHHLRQLGGERGVQ